MYPKAEQVIIFSILIFSTVRTHELTAASGKSISVEKSKGRSLFGPGLEFGIGGAKFSIGGTLHGFGGGYPGVGWGWRPFPSPYLGNIYGGHNGIGFGLNLVGHHHHNHLHHHQYKHHGYGYNLGWGWGFPTPYLPYFH